jgi:uncharacterized protein YukE
VTEANEEVKEAPSRIREKLSQLATVWERASIRSSASESDIVGSTIVRLIRYIVHNFLP